MMAAYYTFEDLSGSNTPSNSDNPYEGLLEACGNDATRVQERYETHRTNRNALQRAKLLSPDFSGVTVDEILAKIEDPNGHPDFKDWRHCLVFWARPPGHIRSLIAQVQERLREVAPNLWTMPPPNLHMTALEITHSLTAQEIEALVNQMRPGVPDITDYTLDHRARLVKPMLSFDAQALALSFLPAAGEPGRNVEEDAYTYHHLRRDLHTKAEATGVKVASRYVIPSAHLTIGRFITKRDFEDGEGKVSHSSIEKLIAKIEEINEWLRQEYWPQPGNTATSGEWVVGQEKGLEYRKGTLWYGGGGETEYLGTGF
ncbi:hypothetical protein BTJ68_00268 [Hortaea werneckii EXF-2000]|uniref:RNA ligase/cyclic nucleotide phosphodiesterase n=2 Tax=Hortaea werneckii TaxID=91943 RepID=A0A1Z5TV17_HORWE|nr:hypothetical protein BTJ68_00268 [Hortaea werneckii EXF-2000]